MCFFSIQPDCYQWIAFFQFSAGLAVRFFMVQFTALHAFTTAFVTTHAVLHQRTTTKIKCLHSWKRFKETALDLHSHWDPAHLFQRSTASLPLYHPEDLLPTFSISIYYVIGSKGRIGVGQKLLKVCLEHSVSMLPSTSLQPTPTWNQVPASGAGCKASLYPQCAS